MFLFLEKSRVTIVLRSGGGWILVLPNWQNILICNFLGSCSFCVYLGALSEHGWTLAILCAYTFCIFFPLNISYFSFGKIRLFSKNILGNLRMNRCRASMLNV